MKSFLAVVAALSLSTFASLALAGDVYKASLASSDGGSTNTATISPRLNYSIVCNAPAYYALGSSTLTVDPTTAYRLSGENVSAGVTAYAATGTFLTTDAGVGGSGSGTTASTWVPTTSAVVKYKRDFNAGAYNKVAAYAADAGDPGCLVYQNVQ
jgi:hypothetical protein